MRRRPRTVLTAALLVVVSCRVGRAQTPPVLEHQVKAAFLYNFLTFVQWPSSSFATPGQPFRICHFGGGPLRQALETAVRGGSVNERAIVVEEITDERQVASCQVLFVPATAEKNAVAVLRAAERLPVLVVGETRRILDLCGAIAFALDGERVRFDINVPAITDRGLTVSSKLLHVAREASDHFRPCE